VNNGMKYYLIILALIIAIGAFTYLLSQYACKEYERVTIGNTIVIGDRCLNWLEKQPHGLTLPLQDMNTP
jgi:hypothetical protein